MDVGTDLICLVKNNTKCVCKYYIKNMENYWPGGSYLVFKRNSMLPVDMLILAIGYKYNYLKVVYFISNWGLGSTKAVIPYYLSTLTILIMFMSVQLFSPRSCLNSFYM